MPLILSPINLIAKTTIALTPHHLVENCRKLKNYLLASPLPQALPHPHIRHPNIPTQPLILCLPMLVRLARLQLSHHRLPQHQVAVHNYLMPCSHLLVPQPLNKPRQSILRNHPPHLLKSSPKMSCRTFSAYLRAGLLPPHPVIAPLPYRIQALAKVTMKTTAQAILPARSFIQTTSYLDSEFAMATWLGWPERSFSRTSVSTFRDWEARAR